MGKCLRKNKMDILIKECVFCSSEQVRVIQKINTSSIVDLYQQNLNVNVIDDLSELTLINAYKCDNCKLVFFDKRLAGNGLFYEKLQKNDKDYYSNSRPEFKYTLPFITENSKVLEIGSGSGFFAEQIKDKCSYIGLEFNDAAIKNAAKRDIKLVKQSIEDFSITNRSKFNVALSFHVLEHVQNPKEFIECSLDCIKPNGKMIIAVPCNNSPFTGNRNHVLNLPPHHISRWYLETMEQIASIYNLNILDYSTIGGESNRKGYVENKMIKWLLDLLYPKSKLVISHNVYKKYRKVLHHLNRRLGLTKFFKKETIGSNMIFVFEKKS